MKSAKDLIDSYVMQTYGRSPVTFVRGRGVELWDDNDKNYKDFLAGIAVVCLGHAHPAVTKAVCEQAGRLTHVCNLFYTEQQGRVAQLLVENSFADRVFFCNSGAEANEGALKLSRLWGKEHMNGAYGIIAMKGSFHGRTMHTLTATGQDKIQKGYNPLPPGYSHTPYGDLKTLEAAWEDNTAAVLLEPILGEGGVVIPSPEFMTGVRRLCDERGALMILDEVQTGLGRTGRLFAHEHFGITPDVMTLAKALGNGLPVGAICARQKVADLFTPGTHGTTFGAGPVVMAAARVVLEHLTAPGFMDQVQETGVYFLDGLKGLAQKHPDKVAEARGAGLMLGLELKGKGADLVKRLMDMGYVVNCTQDTVLRFLPPLIVSKQDIDGLIKALDETLGDWQPEA